MVGRKRTAKKTHVHNGGITTRSAWRPQHALTFMGHLQFLRVKGELRDDEGKVDALASLLAEVLTRNKLFNVGLLNPNAGVAIAKGVSSSNAEPSFETGTLLGAA